MLLVAGRGEPESQGRAVQLDERSDEYLSVSTELIDTLRACHRQLVVDGAAAGRRPPKQDPTWDAMCRAIGRFASYGRASGLYPELVLVRLKQLLGDVAPGLTRESPLRGVLLRCCLDAYFPRS
jgi:hypothetical protein